MEVFTEIIGYIAAVLGTSIMIPQLIKSLKTKSVKDISTWTLVLFLLNNLFWITYGILINSLPVALSNGIVFMIVFTELSLKVKYR
jgi:MtN3 and saliva related transmembrane protein